MDPELPDEGLPDEIDTESEDDDDDEEDHCPNPVSNFPIPTESFS